MVRVSVGGGTCRVGKRVVSMRMLAIGVVLAATAAIGSCAASAYRGRVSGVEEPFLLVEAVAAYWEANGRLPQSATDLPSINPTDWRRLEFNPNPDGGLAILWETRPRGSPFPRTFAGEIIYPPPRDGVPSDPLLRP